MYEVKIYRFGGKYGHETCKTKASSIEDAIKEVREKISDEIGDFLITADFVDPACGHTVYVHTWNARQELNKEFAYWRRIEEELVARVRDVGHEYTRWAVTYHPLINDKECLERAADILRRAVPGVDDPIFARAILAELQRAEKAREAAEYRLAHLNEGEGTYYE